MLSQPIPDEQEAIFGFVPDFLVVGTACANV
jgi:hypothetical protein